MTSITIENAFRVRLDTTYFAENNKKVTIYWSGTVHFPNCIVHIS